MSTDNLVVQVAGHLEIGDAPGGRGLHRELCRRLKPGARTNRIALARDQIRRGIVVFEPIGVTQNSAPVSPADAAIAAYRRGGWRAFDECCSENCARGHVLNTHDLVSAGLLDTVADKAAEAFVGSRNGRKKVHEHISFIKRHEPRNIGWLMASAFARAAYQWVELDEEVLAARLYRGAHEWAPPEMVQSAFWMKGLDALNLSRVHRYRSQRPLLRAAAA